MNTTQMDMPHRRHPRSTPGLPVVVGRRLLPPVQPTGIIVRRTRLIEREEFAAVRVFGAPIGESRPVVHRKQTTCYWKDAGWEQRGDYMIGAYRAKDEVYLGSIQLCDSVVEPLRFHIYDPPGVLLDGPHGPCYRREETAGGRRRYYVHFAQQPDSIDSGIIQIERNLVEARAHA